MYILPVIVDISDIVALVVGVEGGGHPVPGDVAVVEAGDEDPRRLAQVHRVVVLRRTRGSTHGT